MYNNNYNPNYNGINFNDEYPNFTFRPNGFIDYPNENFQNLISLNQINNTIEKESDFYDKEIENDYIGFSQRKTHETSPNCFIDNKIINKKNGIELPKLYYFYDIKNIYENRSSDLVKKIKNNLFIEKEEKKMETIEQKEKNKQEEQTNDFVNDNLFILIPNDNIKEGKKRGREPENKEYNVGSHNKMSPDNIIKKIKAQIFIYPLYFLNNISNKANSEKEIKINKLDYQFVNRMKKDLELKFLDTPLKDLFSMNISPKYIKKSKFNIDSNKEIIKNILNNEADDTIMFSFNMTLRDWFDLFTFKKNVNDIMDSYGLSNDNSIDIQRIVKCMVYVDELLNEMASNNDDEVYFSNFIFYLYNYERWFYIKKGRNRKSNKNK